MRDLNQEFFSYLSSQSRPSLHCRYLHIPQSETQNSKLGHNVKMGRKKEEEEKPNTKKQNAQAFQWWK